VRYGPLLVECAACGCSNLPVVWEDGSGWCCAGCGVGIHGENQTPQVDVTEIEQQLDMGF